VTLKYAACAKRQSQGRSLIRIVAEKMVWTPDARLAKSNGAKRTLSVTSSTIKRTVSTTSSTVKRTARKDEITSSSTTKRTVRNMQNIEQNVEP